MSYRSVQTAARRSGRLFMGSERALKAAELKSLREYRLKKIATRHMPSQPRSA